ncbi:MAG: hypothetical protein WDZ49_12760, partial [Litorilinea sp.]
SGLLEDIKMRYSSITDLRPVEGSTNPMFEGILEVEYSDTDSSEQLLPYIRGRLDIDQVPPVWKPSSVAVEALIALLNAIFWLPPDSSPRIVGHFVCEFTTYQVDDDGPVYEVVESYQASGGLAGGSTFRRESGGSPGGR